MKKLDTLAEATLKKLFNQGAHELAISSPEYDKGIIDYLIDEGFLTKLDASTLSGWLYLISLTHKSTIYFDPLTVFDDNPTAVYHITNNNQHVEIKAEKVMNKKSFNGTLDDSTNTTITPNKKSFFRSLIDLLTNKK